MGINMKTIVKGLVAAIIITLLIGSPMRANNNSTSLSFEPELVRVPHLELEQGLGRFYIDLRLGNVQDLKWFKFTIVFDGDILETIPREWHGDPSQWSGGGTSSGSSSYGSYAIESYELENPISGSGILLSFWFKTRVAGMTHIQLRQVELRDTNDSIIPCTFTGNIVEVLSFDTWLDGEYERLGTAYDELQSRYADLEVIYDTLSNDYDSLNSSCTSLQQNYTSLSSRYTSLESDYTTLNSSYSSIKEDYASLNIKHLALEADYSSLESDYDDLKLDHQSTAEQLESIKDQVDTTQMLLYGFIGLTAVLVGTVVFLVVQRRGQR